YRKLIVLIGATLSAFPLSLLSYYGNILPYIASYYHAHRNEMFLYIDPLWVTSSFVCAYTIAMIFTSPLELRFGMLTCLQVSNIILGISVMSGYFTVREPLALTLIFGGVQGISVGVLYTLTLKALLQVMSGQKGVASGIMTSGPVIGALLNTGVAFAVINANNKTPDLKSEGDSALAKEKNLPNLVDMHPKEVVKTFVFWCVWIAFMSSNHTTYLQMNLYKQYGQLSISDDSMLVTTGIISNAGMMVIRPLVGLFSDKFSIRNTTIAFHSASCIFMGLMMIVIRPCPLLYMVFVVIENMIVSPHTLLFSILTATEFGNTHFASNMGLVCSGNIALILLEPYIVNAIVSSVGWDWLF
ncbi:hypothetical protein EGW08_005543, partial [Elysia chlorotica]